MLIQECEWNTFFFSYIKVTFVLMCFLTRSIFWPFHTFLMLNTSFTSKFLPQQFQILNLCLLPHPVIPLSSALWSASLSISLSSVPASLHPSVLLWCPGAWGRNYLEKWCENDMKQGWEDTMKMSGTCNSIVSFHACDTDPLQFMLCHPLPWTISNYRKYLKSQDYSCIVA